MLADGRVQLAKRSDERPLVEALNQSNRTPAPQPISGQGVQEQLVEFAARYRPELAAGTYRIKWLSYDWGLNVASTEVD